VTRIRERRLEMIGLGTRRSYASARVCLKKERKIQELKKDAKKLLTTAGLVRDCPSPAQNRNNFQQADFNWRSDSPKFRLAMRGRLSATRSDSALPIAKVSHSFRVSFGRRGKRHSGRVSYTRVVQKRIWRKLIRIEVNKDRSTNLCTGRFGSVLCLSKRPSCR
jgi:hypothetical protein